MTSTQSMRFLSPRERIQALADLATEFLEHEESVEALAELATETLRRRHKVLVCGNGGSATQASHFAAELSGRYKASRSPLPAIALTDVAAMSAIANDFGYEFTFRDQVRALGAPGDLLVCLTTSGLSTNVQRAAREAKSKLLKVAAITGQRGPSLSWIEADVDCLVWVPSDETSLVQELTLSTLHSVAERVDMGIGG